MESLYNITAEFNWSHTNLPKNSRILVEDTCYLNSSFLIHHFLMMGIKAGAEIYLAALEITYEQYNTVLKKNGINLEKCIQSNQIHYYSFKESTETLPIHTMKSYSEFSTQLLNDLKQNSEKKKPTFILIDDLSLLNHTNDHLLALLRDYSSVLEDYTNYTWVYRYHRDLYSTQTLNMNSMIHRLSDYIITLLPLETGHSTTAHAQLLFKTNTVNGLPMNPIKRLVRIMEGNIKVITSDDL